MVIEGLDDGSEMGDSEGAILEGLPEGTVVDWSAEGLQGGIVVDTVEGCPVGAMVVGTRVGDAEWLLTGVTVELKVDTFVDTAEGLQIGFSEEGLASGDMERIVMSLVCVIVDNTDEE